MIEIYLGQIAIARSGDKGNAANIGVIALNSAAYEVLREKLTAKAVQRFLAPLAPTAVDRFELPNLEAFNFVVKGVLAGGGSRSLRLDSQGKALGQALLAFPLKLTMEEWENCQSKPGVKSCLSR